MSCWVDLLMAARLVAPFLSVSTDVQMSDSMYRSPSMSLRQQADAIDAKDAAVRQFRDALAACEKEQAGR